MHTYTDMLFGYINTIQLGTFPNESKTDYKTAIIPLQPAAAKCHPSSQLHVQGCCAGDKGNIYNTEVGKCCQFRAFLFFFWLFPFLDFPFLLSFLPLSLPPYLPLLRANCSTFTSTPVSTDTNVNKSPLCTLMWTL